MTDKVSWYTLCPHALFSHAQGYLSVKVTVFKTFDLCTCTYNYFIVIFYTATITRQPGDVTVPFGGTAVFTCLVELDENVNPDDVQWNHMGNAITPLSTNPYMVINDISNGVTQLNSTLMITNVKREHVGPYQFVLDLNDGDVMSRRATLTVLIGTKKLISACLFLQIVNT